MGLAVITAACTPEEKEKPQPKISDPSKAPQVVSTIPEANDPAADLVDEIVITYDKPVFFAPNTTISVNGVYNEDVYLLDNSLYIPVELRGGVTYTVKVASPTIKDSEGNFSGDYTLTFTTLVHNNFKDYAFSIDENPSDPEATDAAKALYAEMKENFGKKIYSATMAEVNWNYENAEAVHQMTGKYPAINAFDYIHLPSSPSDWIDYSDITPVRDWVSLGGIVAAGWHWLVPTSDPNYVPEPEPEYPDDVVIDFEDVVIGDWDTWQIIEASALSSIEVGTVMNIYYKGAASDAQMALKDNVSGWPGFVDGNGFDYSYFSIPEGDGYYSVELDDILVAAMKANGMVISGKNFTVTALGLNAPGTPVEYVDTEIDFEDIVTGNWADYKYLEPSYFTSITLGSKITVYYKDASGAQMGLKEPSSGWPGLVDDNGTSYEYFNIPDGEGTYVLSVDNKILASLQAYGLVIGGHDYTICKAVLSIPKSEVSGDDVVIDINIATGNWADYKYLEASTFLSCSVGTKLVIHYSDASGAQMGLKDPGQTAWPGIVDENNVDYSYFTIPDGEGDYTLTVDATVLAVIQSSGLVIGGHDYTIVSLTIKNPAPAASSVRRTVAPRAIKTRDGDDTKTWEYSFSSKGNEFNPADALSEGHWQNKIVKDDLDKLVGYLKLLQDENIPVLFRPLHEASGGWFWWGSRSGADYVALWKYVYEYITGAGVHNLLWVWTSCLDDSDWYPGDAYVDFIAYDWYPQETELYHTSGIDNWNDLLKISNHKMLTLGECGAMPSVTECLVDGSMWSWWMPWYGEHMTEPHNSAADFRAWMASSYVISATTPQAE